jgi:uncharacterized protein
MAGNSGTLSANFHLTHNCNLRCTYCYTGEKFGAGMTNDVADQAVDFCLEEGQRQDVEHVEFIFFGGEPLMKLDLLCRIADRAIERADGRRISFKMSTNGLLLSERAIERLAARDVYVSISLDGDPELQAEQRPDVNGRAVTEQLDAAITRLLRWNPCASVNCVTTPHSAARLDDSVRWIFERGFAYVQTALDYSADWTRQHLKDLSQAYERLGKWYVEQTTSGRKFYLSCFDSRIHSWTHGPLDPTERCFAGQRQFSIAPSGRLYPCVQFVEEDRDDCFVIGDVTTGFDQNKRNAMSYTGEKEKPECGGCALTERCSSWCACINWQSTGQLDQASPLVCEHERLLMPIADRVANRLWKIRNPQFIHKHYNPAFPVLSFVEDLVIHEIDEEVSIE